MIVEKKSSRMKNSERTKKWIEDFIIKLSICPYAKPAFDHNQYLIWDYSIMDFMQALQESNQSFESNDSLQTILICFNQDLSLDQALDLLDFTEDWMENESITRFQTVLFHPEYIHAEVENDSPIHYTNRAPNTIIQLIKMDAIEKYHKEADTEIILKNNRDTLNKIGSTQLEKLLDEFRR